jgi:hypothetical protein
MPYNIYIYIPLKIDMTKQSLQAAAELASGISYEDSLVAASMNPSLFERVGGEEGFLKLSGKIFMV